MSFFLQFIYNRRWLRFRSLTDGRISPDIRFGYLSSFTLLIGILLISCSGVPGGGNTGSTGSPAAASVAIAKLRWCGKPMMVFRDEGVSTTGTPASGDSQITPTVTATAR